MKVFRLFVVRFSLLLTGLGAVCALALSRAAAQGFLLGGLASTLAFWISARAMEKGLSAMPENERENEVAITNKNKLMFAASFWVALRMALYGTAVLKGYYVDPSGLWGCWGAIGGLFVVRVVVSVLAISGWDLKKVA